MPIPHFILSAFGDEADADLAKQIDVLASEGVRHLEFRAAWGRNILDLDREQLAAAVALLRERDFHVSAIGSPIGKSNLTLPREYEMERLERAIVAAEALDTPLIRVFSFYIPEGQAAEHREEVLGRMAALAGRAAEAGMTLVHENEREIYGDIPERCADLMRTVGSPALRNAFDAANFVQVGVRPMDEGWPLLAGYTNHIHIKDAVFADKSVRAAGEGDGQVPELLQALADQGYEGFLTVEPHLKVAGPFGGFSGEEGMRVAIRALRRLIEAVPGDIRVD